MKRAIRHPPRRLRRDRRADRAGDRGRSATSSSTSPRSRFGRSYYTVNAAFADRRRGHPRPGTGGDDRRRRGRPDRRRPRSQDGQAVVKMNIFKKYAPIYRNATVLLRPADAAEGHVPGARPGDAQRRARSRTAGRCRRANTQPDVDVDQILASLDADTRNYLLLLLSGGAQAFPGPGASGAGAAARRRSPTCSGTLQALRAARPRHPDVRLAAGQRSANLRRAIHNLDLVVELARRRRRPAGLADPRLEHQLRGDRLAGRPARADADAAAARRSSRRTQTLGQVAAFADASGTALHELLPFAHASARR